LDIVLGAPWTKKRGLELSVHSQFVLPVQGLPPRTILHSNLPATVSFLESFNTFRAGICAQKKNKVECIYLILPGNGILNIYLAIIFL
jgi:hypothetical protein